jgi:hypothetical protein
MIAMLFLALRRWGLLRWRRRGGLPDHLLLLPRHLS